MQAQAAVQAQVQAAVQAQAQALGLGPTGSASTQPAPKQAAAVAVKKHECQHCGMAYKTSVGLSNHQKHCETNMQWRCDWCTRGWHQRARDDLRLTD